MAPLIPRRLIALFVLGALALWARAPGVEDRGTAGHARLGLNAAPRPRRDHDLIATPPEEPMKRPMAALIVSWPHQGQADSDGNY